MLWSWKKIIGKRQKSVKKGTFLLFKSGKNHENSMDVIDFFSQKLYESCDIETSQLICCANQVTGLYTRPTLALNGLNQRTT